MTTVRKIFGAKSESGLFNQIALFSSAGLSISLALVLAYDLQIVDQWL
jgi:hypothetical protein